LPYQPTKYEGNGSSKLKGSPTPSPIDSKEEPQREKLDQSPNISADVMRDGSPVIGFAPFKPSKKGPADSKKDQSRDNADFVEYLNSGTTSIR